MKQPQQELSLFPSRCTCTCKAGDGCRLRLVRRAPSWAWSSDIRSQAAWRTLVAGFRLHCRLFRAARSYGFAHAGYSRDWVTCFCLNLVWFAATFVCLVCTAPEHIGNTTSAGGRHRTDSRVRLSFVSVPSGSFVSQADWANDAEAREVQQTEDPTANLVPGRSASSAATTVENLPVYGLMTLCVSSLFFVSGGLQFWATPYMEQIRLQEVAPTETCASEVQKSAHNLVVTLVAVITLTAPTFGVFLGGSAVDSIGGYRGNAGRTNLKMLAAGGCF